MAFEGTVIHLNVPAAVEAGTAVCVKHLMAEKSIQFSGMQAGTFTSCTAQVQGSNDNVNWAQIGSDVTLNGIVSVTTPTVWLRINITSYSSGTPAAVLCGYGPGYTG